MAIIECIGVKKGNLKAIIKYVTNEQKTDKNLVYTKNCNIQTAKEEFEITKKQYSKTGGRQYFHIIQSFSPNDNVDANTVNKIGIEMSEYFKDYELIMTTHTDKEHLHNHFVINSVSFLDGKKYNQNRDELEKIKEFSDNICLKYNLNVIKRKTRSRHINRNEYRLSMKEETNKDKLKKVINKAMQTSKNKSEFIQYMNENGYKVSWQDTRKYITYTLPNGNKIRDKRLDNDKYLKDEMEKCFEKINQIENKRKIINTISIMKYKRKTRENIKNNNKGDLSDNAKKDFAIEKENSSSIEW